MAMARGLVVAAVALCFAGAAVADPTQFYEQCDLKGCAARCAQFVAVDPDGLGFDWDGLANRTLNNNTSGNSTIFYSLLDNNAARYADKAFDACFAGCQAYNEEPAGCDMRCSAYVQDAVTSTFDIPTNATEWYDALFSNESQLFDGGLNPIAIPLLIPLITELSVLNTTNSLEELDDILRLLGMPDSVEYPLTGLLLFVLNRIQIVGQLDNFCTAGCHHQQVACKQCRRNGKDPKCFCDNVGCTKCNQGECKRCLGNKGQYKFIDGQCFYYGNGYNLNYDQEDPQGESDTGVGGNNEFEITLTKKEKKLLKKLRKQEKKQKKRRRRRRRRRSG